MATYREINSLWPDPMPVPTSKEAIAGTRRLIRRAFALAAEDGKVGFMGYGPYMKRTRFKATQGRRFTYPRNRVWFVNPDHRGHGGGGGWGEIVHAVSHWSMRRWWPHEDPHAPRHVYLERELAAYAVENFLNGQLVRPEKPKPDVKAVRAARVAARLKVWKVKRKRADTAIRKLQRQARYYGLETNC